MGYLIKIGRFYNQLSIPDNKVHGAYMGPTWGRQDPGGPHDGPMNLAIRKETSIVNTFLIQTGDNLQLTFQLQFFRSFFITGFNVYLFV